MGDPRATTEQPLLDVRGAGLVRDGRPILTEVSLTVRAGEHWALLGANGAGKSTLLSLLGARTHPTSGTVEVLGHPLGRVDLRQLRAYVGHVDPRHDLRTPLRVPDVILTGATNTLERVPRWTPTDEQRSRAEYLAGLLGLRERSTARWPTLSQGERGRVLIARALMPEPRLLLLDEPATGLDLAGREQLVDRIDLLQSTTPGLASVLVTHHLEELPPGTTHVMLLKDGRCLSAGPIHETLTADSVSKCFDHPVDLTLESGRWSVRTRRVPGPG
ncbi:putative ABC transporter ATP-binding protein YlmA [Streptomyces sp. YIM 130001]|uniref:ABC transporter ATP-binding protein n=1 Tax=Streptomyces sp. YIM 130001 TaxID=2259644 RepID=UPI000E648EAF|nr:ATP-binding cassette domain-containing protein [Streptomyces sp. YIM 130001]RII11975.1 putative ABC transporter ATP-binding protein YlmA [Streptomyces sp. YIM 130001]